MAVGVTCSLAAAAARLPWRTISRKVRARSMAMVRPMRGKRGLYDTCEPAQGPLLDVPSLSRAGTLPQLLRLMKIELRPRSLVGASLLAIAMGQPVKMLK